MGSHGTTQILHFWGSHFLGGSPGEIPHFSLVFSIFPPPPPKKNHQRGTSLGGRSRRPGRLNRGLQGPSDPKILRRLREATKKKRGVSPLGFSEAAPGNLDFLFFNYFFTILKIEKHGPKKSTNLWVFTKCELFYQFISPFYLFIYLFHH